MYIYTAPNTIFAVISVLGTQKISQTAKIQIPHKKLSIPIFSEIRGGALIKANTVPSFLHIVFPLLAPSFEHISLTLCYTIFLLRLCYSFFLQTHTSEFPVTISSPGEISSNPNDDTLPLVPQVNISYVHFYPANCLCLSGHLSVHLSVYLSVCPLSLQAQ